jgi:hypothetical protein
MIDTYLRSPKPNNHQDGDAVYVDFCLVRSEDLIQTTREKGIAIPPQHNASSEESRASRGLTLRRFDGTGETDCCGGACEEEQAKCCGCSGGVGQG